MPKPPETLGQKAARLQAEVDALTTRLENYASIEQRLEEVLAENETLRNGQNASNGSEAQWRNQIQEAQTRATKAAERVAELEREVKALGADKSAVVTYWEQRVANAMSATEKAEERALALQNGLDMATRAANQSGQRVVDASTALAEKDRQLGEVRRELAQLRATTTQVIEELRHQVGSFDTRLKDKDQQLLRLQQTIQDLSQVTESWKQRAVQAEGGIAAKDQRAALLERTIAAQRQRLGDVQEYVTRTYELLQRSL